MGNCWQNICGLLGYDPSCPMLFSSGLFWALFLIFMPLYGMLKRRWWQMAVFVIAFSFYFYYKSSGMFVVVLAFTSLVDWLLSIIMTRPEATVAQRRACVALSLVTSLGILVYFKYADFFLWNVNALVGSNFQPLELILPVGVSFYTFQSVSYIVDVYKRKVQPASTWLEYVFFLSFFPALVAGPIVRAGYFLPQIRQNRHADRAEVYTGLWLIIVGVVKKAIIADYIAQYNDLIFSSPGTYSGFETLMGVLGYTIQIYCDFSGYSDMAIGIAMIMGFCLAENFNYPYKSYNITEFWHRWHISLSTWLRDYIYIPLGGNRKGKRRTYVNSFVTMLVGGLWHGAAWKFVFWGAMHGVGLAVHKGSRPWLDRLPDNRLVKIMSWLATMAFVSLLWVFFRADNFADAVVIIERMATDFSFAQAPAFASARMIWLLLMLVVTIAHLLPENFSARAAGVFVAAWWPLKLVVFVVVVQLVLECQSADVVPFIYFRF